MGPRESRTRGITLLGASACLIAAGSFAANAQSSPDAKPGSEKGAQIKVQEQQPKVNVQQAQPEVKVTQPQPQVTVTQPKPEVTVTQPKPEVQVQQAQPSVQVQQEGQPKVNVQQQGEPKVTVQQEAKGQSAQPSQAQPGQQSQAQQGIGALQKAQIVGKTLYDRNNKSVGQIESAQEGSTGNILSAELDVGGFLGLGTRRVAIPADQLQLEGDRLITSMTDDQIRNLPEASNR
jgi:outer membrane biosynthesis protein TonB